METLRFFPVLAAFLLVCEGALAGPWSDALEVASPDPAAVQKLIAQGANVNALEESLSQDNRPPLQMIVGEGAANLAIARILIKAGADVNGRDSFGGTPLHAAAMAGSPLFTALLLQSGAKTEMRDSEGLAPLHRAASTGEAETVKALLAGGADPVVRDPEGETPLHKLRIPTKPGVGDSVAAAEALLSAGALIDAQSDTRRTPLHNALRLEKPDLAAFLLAHDADRGARDSLGRGMEHMAAETNGALLTLVLDGGGSVGARDDKGETPLHAAAGVLSVEAATILLERGADVDAMDADAQTPLHKAAIAASVADDPAFVSLLVEAGADLELEDKAGETPLVLAFNPSIRAILDEALLTRDPSIEGDPELAVLEQEAADAAKIILDSRILALNQVQREAIPLSSPGGIATMEDLRQRKGLFIRARNAAQALKEALINYPGSVADKVRAADYPPAVVRNVRGRAVVTLTEAPDLISKKRLDLDVAWAEAMLDRWSLMEKFWGKWSPDGQGFITSADEDFRTAFTALTDKINEIQEKANALAPPPSQPAAPSSSPP